MNWYKIAYKSRLISVPLKGILKQTDDGYIYLSVSNDVIHGLFSLIDEENIEKALYGDIGAHISVMNEDEFEEEIKIGEIGKEFVFKLGKFHSTEPDGWDEMERVWFITCISPELEKLRKKYGLPKTYKNMGHEFHCTIAIRKKK